MSSRRSNQPPIRGRHRRIWWDRLARGVRGYFSLDVSLDPLKDRWTEVARRVRLSRETMAQFRARQPALSDAEVALVVEALRQWIRIEGRHPEHVLPSRAVHELESLRGPAPRMLDVDAVAYPYNPKYRNLTMTATELQGAFIDALRDEGPAGLPLLFRVDEEVRWPGGLSYRGACTELPCQTIDDEGRICLHMGWLWSVPVGGGGTGGGF